MRPQFSGCRCSCCSMNEGRAQRFWKGWEKSVSFWKECRKGITRAFQTHEIYEGIFNEHYSRENSNQIEYYSIIYLEFTIEQILYHYFLNNISHDFVLWLILSWLNQWNISINFSKFISRYNKFCYWMTRWENSLCFIFYYN